MVGVVDATASNVSRPHTRGRTPVIAAILGFLAGAAFWHLVGFWSVVSVAMLGPTDERRAGVSSAPEQVATRTTSLPPATPGAQPHTIDDAAPARLLAELLQCSEALKGAEAGTQAHVKACPPLRQRLKMVETTRRADRALDAREAAERLARGWATGVSRIETGSLQARN
ncbi:MAG: hypothetical protein AB7E80_01215 [Hyphomicrobiaceae bacterium]